MGYYIQPELAVIISALLIVIAVAVGFLFGACFRVGKGADKDMPKPPKGCETCRHSRFSMPDYTQDCCGRCAIGGNYEGYERREK
ncbi:MAG TPA: hypothetical protein DEP23_07995 [Ruminococcaceae bacterium]|nr:hypothetical protein [Oscillospiraceae bacterium]